MAQKKLVVVLDGPTRGSFGKTVATLKALGGRYVPEGRYWTVPDTGRIDGAPWWERINSPHPVPVVKLITAEEAEERRRKYGRG